MSAYYKTVKQYLLELGINIVEENETEELFVIQDEENGIYNMIMDCEEPILILEQLIMTVPGEPGDLFQTLLKMNGDLIHGAYMLTEDADTRLVVWRDTLQLANLDLNELEGSLRAFSLGLAEHSGTLVGYAHKG